MIALAKPLAILPFKKANLSLNVPHLVQNVEPKIKLKCKCKCKKLYRKIKKSIIIGSLLGVTVYEVLELLYDLVKNQLVLRGSRTFWCTTIPLGLEGVSVAIYLCTNAKKIRMIAKTISEVGITLFQGQQQLGNVSFFFLDILLFGETVSITDNEPLIIFHNETTSTIDEMVTTLSDN